MCPACSDTGYLPDGTWCTCDARPFEPAGPTEPAPEPPEAEPITRTEHAQVLVIELDNRAQTVAAIDGLMTWARAFLGPIVALGEMTVFASSFDVVAPKVIAELDRFETALGDVPLIVYQVRRAALEHIGDAAAV